LESEQFKSGNFDTSFLDKFLQELNTNKQT